ncbi:MAG TPA: DUF3883 domain-containing protein [Symbiobacteriaceae bacterium]|nr:DUF3883 domain-containing protein [Symbiobacteriaceae bacterium]
MPPQSENDEQHDNEADLPADAEYREAVIAYELAHGRHAVALDELQPGYDIESFDRPNGSPSRQLLRRIEVKGKGLSWTGAEVVTLTRRQFVDAIDHKPAESGWDFWLYVVQKNPGGGYTVWPIKNPARATARFELRAGAWTWLAEQEQAQAPADPDGHGIPPRFDTDETAE